MEQGKCQGQKEDFYERVADKLELLKLMKHVWVQEKWQKIYVTPTQADNIY